MLISPQNKPKISIRDRVTSLMTNPIRSQARKKGLVTLAKRQNLTLADAKFKQAIRIAQSQNRKI